MESIFKTKEEYFTFKKQFANRFNEKRDFNIWDFVTYAILRNKNPRKCFHNEQKYKEFMNHYKYQYDFCKKFHIGKYNWRFTLKSIIEPERISEAIENYFKEDI